jgi:large subunit ribosomal protein L21
MYAIIRTGGKQAKVSEGDVIDVEFLRAEGEIDFTPLLLVDDAGTVFSQRDVLKDARVVARVIGESAGPKVELFKYKAKSGYRRHQGHRQRYTTLEVIRIDAPEGAEQNTPAPKAAKAAEPAPSGQEVKAKTPAAREVKTAGAAKAKTAGAAKAKTPAARGVKTS